MESENSAKLATRCVPCNPFPLTYKLLANPLIDVSYTLDILVIPLLQHPRRVPLDHMIRRRCLADIPDAVHLVRGLEDDGAGTDNLQLAVHE